MRVLIFLLAITCIVVSGFSDDLNERNKLSDNFETISDSENTYLAPGQYVAWHINNLENLIEKVAKSSLPNLEESLAKVVPEDWKLELRRNLDELSKIELNADFFKATPYWVCFYDINQDLYADLFLTTREGQILCFLGPDFYQTNEVFSEIKLPENSKIAFFNVNNDNKADLLVQDVESQLSAFIAPKFTKNTDVSLVDSIDVSELFDENKNKEIIKNLELSNINSTAKADINQDMIADFVYVTDKGVFYRENIGTESEPEYIKYNKNVPQKLNVQTEYSAAPFSLKVSEKGYRLFVGNQEGQIDVFDTTCDEKAFYNEEPFTKIKTIKKDDIESPVIPFVLDLNNDISVESIIVNTAGDMRIYENADFEKELVKLDFAKNAYPDFFDLNEDSKPDILYFDNQNQLVWRKNTSEDAGAISFDVPKTLKVGENITNAVKDEKFLSLACQHLNSGEKVDLAIGFADGRVRFFTSPYFEYDDLFVGALEYNENNDVINKLDVGEYAIPRFSCFRNERPDFVVGNAEGDVKFYVRTLLPVGGPTGRIRSHYQDGILVKLEEDMGWTQEFDKPEDKEAYFDAIGDDDRPVLVFAKEDVRKVYEKLILEAPKHFQDEIIFAIANTPAPVLRTMLELNSQDILVENAKQIYSMAKQLGYAEIVELEDGRSTLKYKRENGNWEQIPSDIYYWWVVHPRLLFEIPARINCDYWHKSMEEHGVDELTWLRHEEDIYAEPERGDFWRSFFPTNNHYNRKLIDFAKSASSFEQAMKRAHEYVSWTFTDSFMRFGYKTQDLQAIQIYYKGYGSCGEQSIIAAAVARSILIPTAIVTNHGEDHQWDEIYCFGDWIHWDINNLDMDAPWNSTEGYFHNRGVGAINNWWGNDYSEPTTTRVNTPNGAGYTKNGKGYTDVAKINIKVSGVNGPVENAMVLVKSHWNDANQTSVRAYTGADGKVTVEVGEGRKNGYTICAITAAGAAGVQQLVVEENKEYNVFLGVGSLEERKNRVSQASKTKDKYEFEIDFNIKSLQSLLFPPNPTTSRPFRINSETIKKTNYRGTRNFPQPVGNDENLKLYLFTPEEYLNFVSGNNANAFKILTLDKSGKYEKLGVPEECFAVLMNTKSLFIHKKLKAEISMKIPAEAPDIEVDASLQIPPVVNVENTFKISGIISDNSNEVYLEASLNGGISWVDCSDCVDYNTGEFVVELPNSLQSPVSTGKYRLLLRARDASDRMKYSQPIDFNFKSTKHFMNQVFVQDDPETPLPKSSWMLGPFKIEEGTRFMAIKTEGHSEGLDIDLFLFYDKNGNLKLDGMDEEQKKSASPTANEKIFLANPKPGTYWIYAQGWKVEGEQAFADVHISFDYKPRLLKNISPLGAKKEIKELSADFVHIGGILTDKVKIYLDEIDMTSNAKITQQGFKLDLTNFSWEKEAYQVKVQLEDYTGNIDEVTWKIKQDNQSPQILESSINLDKANDGYINVKAVISEDVILKYAFDDGEFTNFKEKKAEFDESLDIFNIKGGKHKLTLKAVDGAGNSSEKILEVEIPDIKIALRYIGRLTETNSIEIPNTTLKFKVKSEDEIIEENIVVLLDGKQFPGVVTFIKDTLYCMPFDSYDFGSHKIEIFIEDKAGNKLSPFVFEFNRDKPEKK